MKHELKDHFKHSNQRITLDEFKTIILALRDNPDNKAYFRSYRKALLRLPPQKRLEACIFTYTSSKRQAFPSPRILFDAAKFLPYSTHNDPKSVLERLIYLSPVGRAKERLTQRLNQLHQSIG